MSNESASRGIVLLGSARSDGDTAKAVAYLRTRVVLDLVDLGTLNIGYYDYGHRNRKDDFLPLMRKITNEYKLIILATPVYWYSMSAVMKTFFDRLTDCLKIEKETGRKMRGMSMAVLSCSNGLDIPKGFYEPFELSASYLGMRYVGSVHGVINNQKAVDNQSQFNAFAGKLGVELNENA